LEKVTVVRDRKVVLVADPNEKIREFILKELTLELLKVETAETSVELLQTFYRIGADLLIVEAEMPDIETGILIDTVKSTSPEIPIIVIAANTSKEFEKHFREKGVFYYATKPFSIELLKLAVKDALFKYEKVENKYL
jgi:DNA-binding NtrC family response regulator